MLEGSHFSGAGLCIAHGKSARESWSASISRSCELPARTESDAQRLNAAGKDARRLGLKPALTSLLELPRFSSFRNRRSSPLRARLVGRPSRTRCGRRSKRRALLSRAEFRERCKCIWIPPNLHDRSSRLSFRRARGGGVRDKWRPENGRALLRNALVFEAPASSPFRSAQFTPFREIPEPVRQQNRTMTPNQSRRSRTRASAADIVLSAMDV